MVLFPSPVLGHFIETQLVEFQQVHVLIGFALGGQERPGCVIGVLLGIVVVTAPVLSEDDLLHCAST